MQNELTGILNRAIETALSERARANQQQNRTLTFYDEMEMFNYFSGIFVGR